jgi:hypothetical protein
MQKIPLTVITLVFSACAPPTLVRAPVAPVPSVEESTDRLRISPAAFTLIDGDAHAWSDEGAVLDCAQGTASSDDAMRIESGICRYGVWSASTDARVAAPSTLRFTFWHDGLIGTTPDEIAEGHLGVSIDGVVVLDAVEPIPSGAAWRSVDVPLQQDVNGGAIVALHLHNHGANHWGFGPLTIEVNP